MKRATWLFRLLVILIVQFSFLKRGSAFPAWGPISLEKLVASSDFVGIVRVADEGIRGLIPDEQGGVMSRLMVIESVFGDGDVWLVRRNGYSLLEGDRVEIAFGAAVQMSLDSEYLVFLKGDGDVLQFNNFYSCWEVKDGKVEVKAKSVESGGGFEWKDLEGVLQEIRTLRSAQVQTSDETEEATKDGDERRDDE